MAVITKIDTFESLNGHNSKHEILSLNIHIRSRIGHTYLEILTYISFDKENHHTFRFLQKCESEERGQKSQKAQCYVFA